MDLVLLAWDFLISSLVVRPFLFSDFLAIFLTLHPAAFHGFLFRDVPSFIGFVLSTPT
jgi:hypothetical protein